jgi:hypothetical protein
MQKNRTTVTALIGVAVDFFLGITMRRTAVIASMNKNKYPVE